MRWIQGGGGEAVVDLRLMTYYKPKNASARGSGKNESASMCCLMGPDILENPRRAAEPNPLEADFRVNNVK